LLQLKFSSFGIPFPAAPRPLHIYDCGERAGSSTESARQADVPQLARERTVAALQLLQDSPRGGQMGMVITGLAALILISLALSMLDTPHSRR
jgi:hypothetical protein